MSKFPLALLIDLSGTVFIGDTPTRGAIQAIAKLKELQIPVLFVSNTTKESQKTLLGRLISFGVPGIKNEDIFTSLSCTARLVRGLNLRPYCLLSDDALHDFDSISTGAATDADCVVVGLAPERFTYACMNHAFRLLQKPETTLIATHKGRYYQTSDGLSLGPGAFVESLEFASGKKAKIVGKPSVHFFHEAASILGVSPGGCCMIGDDVRDDVLGAMSAGMQAVLVKTGKYRKGDESQLSDEPRSSVHDTLADYVTRLIVETK